MIAHCTAFGVRTICLAALLILAACGGGGDSAEEATTATQAMSRITAREVSAARSSVVDAVSTSAAPSAAATGPEPVATEALPVAVAAAEATGPTVAARLLAGTTAMVNLAYAAPNPTLLSAATGPTTRCTVGFTPPAALDGASAAPLPSGGGIFYSSAELTVWRERATSGPFINAGDFTKGSPGDWSVIQANARAFAAGQEPMWALGVNSTARTTHGTLLRDAAFAQLMVPEAKALALVRARLLAEAANPQNDFASQLCLRELDGSAQDAWYSEAAWLLRYTVAYDFARQSLSDADRSRIEAFILRNAYFFAAQLDWGLGLLFPDRHAGSYTRKLRDAASSGEAALVSLQADSNGDCTVNGKDNPTLYAARNYVRADGTPGPRTSNLSQWFNNRKSMLAAAIGAAGVTVGNADLIVRSKRYIMEWLSYGVWSDGSEGEYVRNGDYCIPKQGVIYAAANIQAGLLIGRLLARQGDESLFGFHTREGLFGTESQPGDGDKSLELVAGTHLRLLTGQLPWFQYELGVSKQTPRPQTDLGRTDVYYMQAAVGSDDYHELGLLLGAQYLPKLPLQGLVLRDPAVTNKPFPGSGGRTVATGFGSWAGSWTDAFNALPALLLLR